MRRSHGLMPAAVLLVLVAASSSRGQATQDNPARFREMFLQLDANGDTVLERDEIPEKGKAAFDRLLKQGDANKNGKLELDELRALGQKLAVLNDMPTVLARFKGMDKDGDGKVTRAEFTGIPANFDRIDGDKDGSLSKDEITKFFSARMAEGGAAVTPKAKAAAKAKAKAKAKDDADASKPKTEAKKDVDAGKEKEKAKAKEGPKSPSKEEAADLAQRFKFLDKDGDGKISKGEFLREKLFERLDANKDGFLSPEELAKFMKPETETPETP